MLNLITNNSTHIWSANNPWYKDMVVVDCPINGLCQFYNVDECITHLYLSGNKAGAMELNTHIKEL